MATRIVAGQKRPAYYPSPARRKTDTVAWKSAQRAERIIIVAIGALAARSAGEDITRAILVLVVLMALAEFTDWFIFQRGYRLLFLDLVDEPPVRRRVRSAHTSGSNKRRKKGSGAQPRNNTKTVDQAHKRKR